MYTYREYEWHFPRECDFYVPERLMFVRIVIPPVFQLLGLLLVIISFLSPVPYHGSSISFFYLSPAPLIPGSSSDNDSESRSQQLQPTAMPSDAPNMTEAMATTLDRRKDIGHEMSSITTSDIEFRIGLLGSCFTDASAARHCTPSSMQPNLGVSWLDSAPGLELDVDSLPTTWTLYPPLALIAWLLILVTTGVHVRRVFVWAIPKEDDAPSQRFLLLLRIATYLQDIGALLLLIDMIALRVYVARIIDSFNRDNGEQTLGEAALSHQREMSMPLIMHANTGTGFSCICFSATFFLILSWLERRRLRNEKPSSPTPRVRFYDPESQNEKPARVWDTLLCTSVADAMALPSTKRANMNISAPTAIVSPSSDHTASFEMQSHSTTSLNEKDGDPVHTYSI